MARKIETALIDALREGRDLKQANTIVHHAGPIVEVILHGSLIARRDSADAADPRWQFNLCGYNTPTTRSRLNAVARAHGLNGVFTRAGLPLVAGNAVPVDGWFYP